MTSLETELERLDALLADLKARAFRPGQAPYQGMQELGQFIEEVHTAVGRCLGFDPGRVHIDAWHLEMAKRGYECHAAYFGELNVIYGFRNIASHPTEEKNSISIDAVRRMFGAVLERLPDLTRLLSSHTLVDELFEVQRCSQHQRRASKLFAAIAATGNVQDCLPISLEYALPFIPEKYRGFLKAPPDKQLCLLLTHLGRVCAPAGTDLLNGVATTVIERVPSTVNTAAVREWVIRYGTPVEPGTAPPRLRVVRLSLDRDPRSSGWLLVRDVTVVEPIVPGLAEHLPEFPIPVATSEHLYTTIVGLLNKARVVLAQQPERGIGADGTHDWQQFVLEIEVPCDLTAMEFESIGDHRGRSLMHVFRCITIRPIFDWETLQPIRGLDWPVVHPRHSKNSIAVWATNDPSLLYKAAQGRDCLFTGPTAWSAGGGVPPIVDAFEGFPGAVVCKADDEIEGLGPLYDSEDQRSWPDLLDRVTMLRRSGASLKVLWNDPNYGPVLAESV